MPGSASAPRTVTVKRRGSKRRADADDWDTPRRDTSDPAGDATIAAPTLPAPSTRRLGHSRRVSSPSARPAVAIVGGGISGLAAAFFLRDRGLAVTVLEGSPLLGGKLAVSPVAGLAVDEGAEALLTMRPEGTDLIAALGLDGQRRSPGTTTAAIWTRGRAVPAAETPADGRPGRHGRAGELRRPVRARAGPGPGGSAAAADPARR